MNKAFTLIELLAVIAILAIILLIAVPKIISTIENAKIGAFKTNAQMIMKTIDLKQVQDSELEISSINADNIDELLGIDNTNYESIELSQGEKSYNIYIVGKNKWKGQIVYGPIDDLEIYSYKGSRISNTYTLGENVIGTLYTNGDLIISGTGPMNDDYILKDNLNIIRVFVKNGVTNIGTAAFYSCSNIETIILSNSVTEIKNAAFSNCTALSTLNLGDSLTAICVGAFEAIPNLKKLIIPETLTIEDPVFEYSVIEELTIYSENVGGNTFAYMKELKTVVLKDTVKTIGDNAFYLDRKLEELTLSNNLETIGNMAFNSCIKLKTDLVFPESLTFIGDAAFRYDSSLTSIEFGSAQTIVDDYAFDSCTSLNSVKFSNKLKGTGIEFGFISFMNCTSLVSIEFTNSVTKLGEMMFHGATNLETVVLPSNLSVIPEYAFLNCSKLSSVTIPASVTAIEAGAFVNCTSLTAAYFEGNSPTTVGPDIFANAATGFKVNYHAGATGFANPWHTYPAQVY